MGILKRLRKAISIVLAIDERIQNLENALGKIELRQLRSIRSKTLGDYEVRVHSQWGEDGILQYLIRMVPIERAIFVEFGVENYRESNTRFLLMNNHWRGLVMDGFPAHVATIREDPVYWKYDLNAVCAFVTRENINQLLEENGIRGDIGILSIDIDGNDFWVWDAINSISPRIVVCEYNSIFGSERNVTIPYDPKFQRTRAHYSNLYYGASIGALHSLAKRKGYVLVGGNSAGNNAFFVRKDLMDKLKPCKVDLAYSPSQFRESRNSDGTLSFLDLAGRRRLIGESPVYDVDSGKIIQVKELWNS